MPDAQLLNWLVQGGSFALVCAMMVYIGYILVPKTIAAFERQADKFDGLVRRIEDRHGVELTKRDERDERIATAIDRLADSQDRLSERLSRLEAKSDTAEHKPVDDKRSGANKRPTTS